jgi:hypothetical protein
MGQQDWVKICALLVVYLTCLWSGVKTFLLQPEIPSLTRTVTLEPNFSVCSKYQQSPDRYEGCKEAVVAASHLVLKECSGYIEKLNLCMRSSSNPCATQKSNAERCAEVVVTSQLSSLGY